MYKQWLVLAYLEIPAEFPMVSTCLELSVTSHATAHTRNVATNARKTVNRLKIKLVILFLGIICSSCNRITPSGFWLNYKSELITEKKNAQGPWGGTLYINWSADKNSEFNIKKITELTSQNGWKLIDSTNYKKADLMDMTDLGKPIINLPLKNFTPEPKNANLKSESFPRWIETDFKLYRFKTGWLIFEPGTDDSTQENGFVLISSDNKQMTVYQIWGE